MDFELVSININDLTEAELVDLNNRIVARLRLLNQARAHSRMLDFAIGDEVFGGGLHISRCGWTTEIGPGRHPVSSAYFWYVKCPAGGLAEYYSDEDFVTPAWKPRSLTPSPELFAEWAITGGIDGSSRRQASGPSTETGTAGRASRDK